MPWIAGADFDLKMIGPGMHGARLRPLQHCAGPRNVPGHPNRTEAI
jgi:hypothetical protein